MFKPQQLAMLLSMCWTSLALADNLPQFQGEEVVVTASRQPQSISKTLSDISVITRDDIEQSAASSLPQLLARQPGIESLSTGGIGSQASLYIRGSNANHVVILVDGVRIASATSGTTALENIPLALVDRIEILRGNGSSLYGADAIGGVIQIFTRQGHGAPRFNFNSGMGDHGTVKVGGGVDGKVDNTAFSLQLSQQRTDGIAFTNPDAGSTYNSARDPYQNIAYSASLTQTLSAGNELSARAFQSFGRVGVDNSATQVNTQITRQTGLSVESRNTVTEAWNSTLRFSHSVDHQEAWVNGDSKNVTDLFQTAKNEWLWQNDLKTAAGNILLGADYDQQQVDSATAFSITQRHNAAVFAGYTAEFSANMLQVNLRHDQDEQFGSKTTGSLGYGYRLSPYLTIRASYGTAYKAPTFNDLYFPRTDYGGGYVYAGNPALRPETSRNSELALSYAQAGTKATLTLFHNRISNLITSGVNSDGVNSVVNANQATIQGGTATLAMTWGNWDLSGSVTYQDPLDDTNQQQLQRRARAFGQLSAGYDWGQLTTGVEFSASAKRRDLDYNTNPYSNVWLGGYSLTNLYANYRLSKTWTATARLTNLFDRHYTTAYGYNTLGLGGFVGVSYQGL
ncbi:TonB-dependent receptor domain-containing protein [Aquitalea magnusonii]|uniref:Vitamin B12 transporter n=1 Tax=Aquitalea magnusonii TaxID=332411 RepID=A0A318JIR7_9NEIS|nr:TonB-dependent receptor [Aquitalea magnusonii]PXX43675.1 vitamin B12 transporter [Aquitalea magnusonii]